MFGERTRAWFEGVFDAPTPAQALGWPAIASGASVLIQAPTGSGKTLAAFLYGIDRLAERPGEGLRLLYVSPLKALNYDVERNLRAPLAGLQSSLTVAVRTGDTPQKERQAMLRKPPDILITTPESLFLLLTSQAREMLGSVETLILDEVHAVAGTKRGAHLALSVERLERLVDAPLQRIALSATQRPLEEIGRFVGGGRPIELIDAGRAKELDLEVVVPVEDMRNLTATLPTLQPEIEDGSYITDGVGPTASSIWPSIYPEILRLVEAHRSTIVFVNNRRLAERLALRLNELAERELARAHHGSLAREQRVEIEELLKQGEIPCLVATSSLELGIDMGAVDLVIQVESPKSVARGLQRVGRAGHELGAVSKGRIFPKFRADLLESAVVARRMRDGAIEETSIPRNPLDVLAQQIVAICADDEIAVEELHDLVRRAYPFSDLSRVQLENVLDMLAGRYPSDEFAELRPRIVWDRTGGTIRGVAGARRLAVTNAGTIPDRGLFTVQLADSGSKVGELDEEMVYEAREGQTFLLGASSWRIEEITRDRVIVSPAPGVPGAVPFWKGEGVGRPYELGEAIGRASRELVALDDEHALGGLAADYHLDPLAAENLLTFLREQEAATGAVPSDRTIVVERFRDEIGDWRVCLLTPFGGRVHAPWALALAARLRESLGLDVQSIWSDDGIALHLPDADAPPALDELLPDPAEVEELVLREVGESALFGSRFRENAARSLLIPRRRPGERTPLWQQRLKAQSLLQVARRFPAFPIVLETYRECLQDVFDLPALRELLSASRHARWTSSTSRPRRPRRSRRRCSSTTWRRTCTRTTRRRRSAARRRCRSTATSCASCSARRSSATCSTATRSRRSSASCAESRVLQMICTSYFYVEEICSSGEYDQALAEPLLRERRAVRVRVAGEERLIAAEDAGRYRDALGAMPPSGLPDAFLERDRSGGELRQLVHRWARGRGPFTTAEATARFGRRCRADPARAGARGAARPWRAAPRRHRARVVRPGRPAPAAARLAGGAAQGGGARRAGGVRAVSRFLARHRSALAPARGARAAAGARAPGLAVGVRAAAAARTRLPPRAARPALRDGRDRLDRRRPRPRRRLLPRGRRCAGSRRRRAGARGRSRTTRSATALARSAEFWSDLLADTGLEAEEALPALWDLVWAGEVTNDAWQPLRAPRRYGTPKAERRPRRFARRRVTAPTATQGRWSLVERLFAEPVSRRALAELLLERQGIVTRDGVRAEGIPGGYGAVYSELRALETLGLCRRGYFVEGLGGAQFALGGAVERLRELRPREGEEPQPLVLAAADPAQPYGAALPWPKRADGRAARVAGAYVVLLGGEAALFVERGGRTLAAAPRARRGLAARGARRARRARARGPAQAPGG